MQRSPILVSLTAAGVLAVPPAAQARTIVSPVNAATVEGDSANLFPFGSDTPRRYQQIHSDLGPGGKTIRQLSFRVTRSTVNWTGVRTIDLELYMGFAPRYDRIDRAFARNYIGPRTRVKRRGTVNFGPQGQAKNTVNPFRAMDLMLDAPFPYVGTASLIWEAVVHSSSLAGPNFSSLDADLGKWTIARRTATGTGCVATGQSRPMANATFGADIQGVFGLEASLGAGPANAPAVFALGTANPGQRVPGMCGRVHTNFALLIALGSTDARGAILGPERFSVHLHNTFAGATFHTQIHALDPGRSEPIKVSSSGGIAVRVPAPSSGKVVRVSRMFDSSGTTTAARGLRFSLSTVGYGLVTRFTYQ